MKKILLGAHFSISGGVDKAFDHADKYECSAMQIFTQNSNTWKVRKLETKETEKFFKRQESSFVKNITSHAGYLINLAGPDHEKREKSFEALKGELERSHILGIKNIVLHPGSHMKTSVEGGVKRISESLNLLLNDDLCGSSNILLETMAGQGDCVGHRPEHLAEIIENIDKKSRVGICLDTCHIFASGYDISTKEGYLKFTDKLESLSLLEKVGCIHLNDSKKKCGTRVDRHEHIGKGLMGNTIFELIVNDKRFDSVPKIIELPGEQDGVDMNKKNFERLSFFAQ
ncbi:MAG: deoxyribonuclease IV [Thermodesulfobacteriota bacterium]